MSAPAMTDAEAVEYVHSLGARIARFEEYLNGKGEKKKRPYENDAEDLKGCSLEEAQRWIIEGRWVAVMPSDLNCLVADVDEGGAELQARVLKWREPMFTYRTRPDEDRYHNWYPAEHAVALASAFKFAKGGGEILRGKQWCIPREWPGLARALQDMRSHAPGVRVHPLVHETDLAFWKDKPAAKKGEGGRPRRPPTKVRNRDGALAALLKTIDGFRPVADGDTWLKVGMALHHELADKEEGWKIFDYWSRGGKAGPVPEKYDYKVNRKRWASFKERRNPITMASVLKMAEAHDLDFRREYEAGEMSERAVSERLASSWENRYSYVTDDAGKSGTWAQWVGHRFVEHDALPRIQRDFREVQADLEARGGSQREVAATQTRRFANAVLGYVQDMQAGARRHYDADKNVLNTPDGLIDLTTFGATPHAAPAPFLKSTAVAPGAANECPVWEACLEAWQPDPEVRAFLQRVAGYALLADNREQVLIFLVGEGGNGKSVFIGTLSAVLGDYAAPIDKSAFLGGRNSDAHPTAMMDMHGLRLAIISEVEHESTWSESSLKAATGDEKIKARRMHQDFITFDVMALPVIAANHEPQLRHTDDAMRRRLVLIEWNASFKSEPGEGEGKADTGLPERLAGEHPAILAWMLEGLRAYRERGLAPPEAVTAKVEEYFNEQDVVGEFIRQACYEVPGAVTSASSLYNHYVEWCLKVGNTPLKLRRFGEEMKTKKRKKKGILPDRTKKGNIYRGIQTTTPVKVVDDALGRQMEANATPVEDEGQPLMDAEF